MYEKQRVWLIGDGKWDNKEFSVTNSATSVYCYFKDTGVESSDDALKVYKRYFGLGRGAYHVNLRPSGVVTITQVKLMNGQLITFSNPITVAAASGWTKNYGAEIDYMVIVTQADAINIKLEVN